MESFFKSFDGIYALLKPATSNAKTLVVRQRTAVEMLAAGIMFLISVGFLLQISLTGYPVLALLLLIAASVSTAVFIRDVDVLTIDDDNLVIARGFPGLKTKQVIPRASIEFVGVDIGEVLPGCGKPHMVYVQHNGRTSAVQHFGVGREAIVLAKQVRKFVDL